MVTVIKNGVDQKRLSARFKCSNCGCEFIAEKVECKESDNEEGRGTLFYIECPDCKRHCFATHSNFNIPLVSKAP